MYNELDAKKSRRAFERFILPALKIFGFAQVESTENRAKGDALKELLDFAAIDAVAKCRRGTFGLASRVQFGVDYQSFTIRRSRPSGGETEIDKLRRAFENGGLRPFYHVQAFIVKNEKSATVAVGATSEIYGLVKKNPSRWQTASKGGETFFFEPFDEVINKRVYHVTDKGGVTLFSA